MDSQAGTLQEIQTVFFIVLENQNWAAVKDSTNCPFINQVLLPQASYCEQYYNPPHLHPSLPNYLWLVSGTNFGITNNPLATRLQLKTTNHLAALLDEAGISWKTYQEGLSGLDCPTNGHWPYITLINPFVYFSTITTNPAYCQAHMRPYTELATDLTNQSLARFNFIVPGMCSNMHAFYGNSCSGPSPLRNGDDWLASAVPQILASPAYLAGGALFITWDEGLGDDGPTGMIVLSPLARGGGYHNWLYYTHSSALRTLQDIFGVQPYLADAANAIDLADLFTPLHWAAPTRLTNGLCCLTACNVIPDSTNYVQVMTNLVLTNWVTLGTNSVPTNTFTFFDPQATNGPTRFYRIVEGR